MSTCRPTASAKVSGRTPRRILLATSVSIALMSTASAETATWTNPGGGNWLTASNWNTNAVPSSSADVVIANAPSAAGNLPVGMRDYLVPVVTVTARNNTIIDLFGVSNAGHAKYVFQADTTQPLAPGGPLGGIWFHDTSSGGNALLALMGSDLPINPFSNVIAIFGNNSTAQSSAWTIQGQARLQFQETSTAAQVTAINYNGGMTTFIHQSDAGNAVITNSAGGLTTFGNTATAAGATVINDAGGAVDITRMTVPLVLGSLSGAGDVYLAANSLRIGGLNRNEEISGVIQDGINADALVYYRFRNYVLPSNNSGGSLTKTGSGTLILSADNTYTGGTTITGGTLQLGNGGTSGSLASDVVNDAALVFNRSDRLVFNHQISGAGQVVKDGAGTLILSAENTYTGPTLIRAGVLQLGDGGTSGSIGGDILNEGLLVFSRSDDIAIANAISGSGDLQKNGSGTLALTGSLDYDGTTTVLAGRLALDGRAGGGRLHSAVGGSSAAELLLQNGASLTGTIAGLNVAVDTDSVWTVTGDSRISHLANAGMVDLQSATDYGSYTPKTLQVTSLMGRGGVIVMNTVLGDSGALTDRLIIDGGAAVGTTFIRIRNIGGLGGQTTGNGINLVHLINGGHSEPGAFRLSEPVLAGAYQYSLQQNVGSTDWYLTSDLLHQDSAPLPPGSGGESGGGTPPNTPESPVRPNYRAEASLYSVAPSLALDYGQALVGSLFERRGGVLVGDTSNGPEAWLRTFGERNHANGGSGGVYGGAAGYRSSMYIVQMGADMFGRQTTGSGERAGLYTAFGKSSADVDHHDESHAGRLELTSYSLGAYWTRAYDQGLYVDATLQATRNKLSSNSQNYLELTTNGWGWGVSLEMGYDHAVNDAFSIQPQLQLSANRLDLQQGRDPAVDAVSFKHADSLQARAGARFVRRWNADAKQSLNLWLQPDVVREFYGAPETSFKQDNNMPAILESDRSGTDWRMAVGVDGQINRRLGLSLQARYAQRIDSNADHAYGVEIVVQYVF